MWSLIFLLLGIYFFLFYLIGSRKVGLLLFVAFAARSIAALIHRNIFTLPAGCCDAKTFESIAWQWSQSAPSLFSTAYFNPTQSYVISWIGSGVYSIFGRDPLLLQMINVFLGVLTVYVVYRTALLISQKSTALFIGWIFALHPTLIEHSSVFLREAPVILGLAVSIYFFIKWLKHHRPKYLIGSALGIIFSTIFHGAMIMGLPVIMIIVGIVLVRSWLKITQRGYIKRGVISSFLIFVVAIVFIITVGLPRLSSIGNLEQIIDADAAAQAAGYAAEVRTQGRSAYLLGMTVNNPVDLVWQAPIRIVYFLFSPFPWDVSSIAHLKGFIDSGFLFLIFFLMWKYRRELWVNEVYRYMLIILIIYIVIFSFGTSNFGSAIRHKSKFLPIFVLFYSLKEYDLK